ncbi:ABC transporter G family member [Musa troglodytarum]|uniref:ABC transporter G family member n=1 Tax=Musa troglodytarum TaxID=320322 RepID=A0A9E7EUF1_9LILI|nr:ABC transporter G family member [Musa troglodytarum]
MDASLSEWLTDPMCVLQGRKSAGVPPRRLDLEKEVAELQRMLHDEEKVHEILERALLPQNALLTLPISGLLPKKSFLELGMPSNPEMALGLKNKAALNVGGHKLNALAIKHLILKQSSNSNEDDWKVHKDDKEMVPKDYGLEQSNPNIVFALCSGCKSSPAVRIYTADGVVGELEKSKMDYLQASIAVTTTKRILIPHLLHSNMHDFARDSDSLVDWIVNQLPASWPLRKSMLECLKGRTAAKISHTMDVIPNDSEFQYLVPM